MDWGEWNDKYDLRTVGIQALYPETEIIRRSVCKNCREMCAAQTAETKTLELCKKDCCIDKLAIHTARQAYKLDNKANKTEKRRLGNAYASLRRQGAMLATLQRDAA